MQPKPLLRQLKKHSCSDFGCCVLAESRGHYCECERHSRGRTGTGDHTVESHDEFTLPDTGTSQLESVLKAGITGGVLAVEQSERREHHRGSGTDGSYTAAVLLEQLAKRLEFREIRASGKTSGADEPFGIGKIGVVEATVGHNFNAVGTTDITERGDADGFDGKTGATQYVDSGKSFYLLEALGQKDVGSAHTINYFGVSTANIRIPRGFCSILCLQTDVLRMQSQYYFDYFHTFATYNSNA